MAACSIANIVKSSLGPVGLDKMLVDDVGVSYLFCIYIYIYMNNRFGLEIEYINLIDKS